jgi:hypothetical protein
VLFDSDAREPGKPSEDSKVICGICRRERITCHQLVRREIENYLPQPALASWIKKSPKNRQARLQGTLDAFEEMSLFQRHHYNMRRGFEQDRKSESEIPAFNGEWGDHKDLQNGFGKDITTIFHERDFQKSWLLDDGQREEMLRMAQSIFRRL